MPWLFVLIWSTGFIVARYGMAYASPLRFLSLRYALSIVCFASWIALARPAWPRDRGQALHLAVVGVLMQAGYLGGVWSAVKAGIGAGTVALLVGLQPVLTALWLTHHPAQGRQRIGGAVSGGSGAAWRSASGRHAGAFAQARQRRDDGRTSRWPCSRC